MRPAILGYSITISLVIITLLIRSFLKPKSERENDSEETARKIMELKRTLHKRPD